MIKIWTGKQVDLLEQKNQYLVEGRIPKEVITTARDIIQILDESYGSNRDPDSDLGGYVCIFDEYIIGECNDYKKLLGKYGLSVETAEFTEPIMTSESYRRDTNYQWYQQVFIVSSDFAVCVIYKDTK
jgi:hypothetical protein